MLKLEVVRYLQASCRRRWAKDVTYKRLLLASTDSPGDGWRVPSYLPGSVLPPAPPWRARMAKTSSSLVSSSVCISSALSDIMLLPRCPLLLLLQRCPLLQRRPLLLPPALLLPKHGIHDMVRPVAAALVATAAAYTRPQGSPFHGASGRMAPHSSLAWGALGP